MRSYPPQYPRSSTPLTSSPSLFFFYFCPFLLRFPLFSLCLFIWNFQDFMRMSTQRIFASNLPYQDRKPKWISKFSKNLWQWWQAMACHFILLPCALALPHTSHLRRHHAQSLLGLLFHSPRTPHVLESQPEQTAPLSRRDNEPWHAIGSHSALALRACNPSLICRFWVLDHLCSNWSPSFCEVTIAFYITRKEII